MFGRPYDVFTFYPEQIAISAGASLLVPAMPGQMGVQIKYLSGGSLLLSNIGDSTGSSNAIAQSYLFGTSEAPLLVNMIGAFYLSAVGATAVANVIRFRTSPALANTLNGAAY